MVLHEGMLHISKIHVIPGVSNLFCWEQSFLLEVYGINNLKTIYFSFWLNCIVIILKTAYSRLEFMLQHWHYVEIWYFRWRKWNMHKSMMKKIACILYWIEFLYNVMCICLSILYSNNRMEPPHLPFVLACIYLWCENASVFLYFNVCSDLFSEHFENLFFPLYLTTFKISWKCENWLRSRSCPNMQSVILTANKWWGYSYIIGWFGTCLP